MCGGCRYEFEEAGTYQRNGFFFATSKIREFVEPCLCGRVACKKRKHFGMWMVDKNGEWVVK